MRRVWERGVGFVKTTLHPCPGHAAANRCSSTQKKEEGKGVKNKIKKTTKRKESAGDAIGAEEISFRTAERAEARTCHFMTR